MNTFLGHLTSWLLVNLCLVVLLFLVVPIIAGYDRQRERHEERRRERPEPAQERATPSVQAPGVIPIETRRATALQLHGRGGRTA